ncbi:MAG: hypothetical protein ACPGVB_08495 [Chitinophagales bacterium]
MELSILLMVLYDGWELHPTGVHGSALTLKYRQTAQRLVFITVIRIKS